MTTRPYELFARFAADGTVAGASVRTIASVNGRDYESDPEPLSGAADPAFVEFAEQFAAAAQVERDTLRTAKAELEKQLQTVASVRDQLEASLTGTTDSLAVATAERDALQAQLDGLPALQEQLDAALAELDALKNPVVNPRHVAPYVFLSLLKPSEIYQLQTSADPVVVVGRAKLQTIITYVDLDLPETVMLVEYLESSGLAEKGRAAQILAGELP